MVSAPPASPQRVRRGGGGKRSSYRSYSKLSSSSLRGSDRKSWIGGSEDDLWLYIAPSQYVTMLWDTIRHLTARRDQKGLLNGSNKSLCESSKKLLKHLWEDSATLIAGHDGEDISPSTVLDTMEFAPFLMASISLHVPNREALTLGCSAD